MRAITPNELAGCVQGARKWEIRDEHLHFHRFPEAALAVYDESREVLGLRARCTAGILLDFVTDSPFVNVRGRSYGGVERIRGHMDLVREHAVVSTAEVPLQSDGFALRLQTGMEPGDIARRFRLWLPHSIHISLEAVELADGAHFSSGTPSRTILMMGDSITQGMDATHPSSTYAAITATQLDMTLVNYAVGGAIFCDKILPERPLENPTLITVAYGVNDYHSGASPDAAEAFLRRLHELYPETPTAVLEPLWVGKPETENNTNTTGLTFASYREQVRAAVEQFDMMYWVPRGGLLPPDSHFLADGVHPTGEGHLLMGLQLSRFLYEMEKERLFEDGME